MTLMFFYYCFLFSSKQFFKKIQIMNFTETFLKFLVLKLRTSCYLWRFYSCLFEVNGITWNLFKLASYYCFCRFWFELFFLRNVISWNFFIFFYQNPSDIRLVRIYGYLRPLFDCYLKQFTQNK